MSQSDIGTRSSPHYSPTRPGSSWTTKSFSADSAISLRSNTPRPTDDGAKGLDLKDQPTHITNRLNGLVSEIWAFEQDGTLHVKKKRRIEKAIDLIEAALIEDDVQLPIESHANADNTDEIPLESRPNVEKELEMVRRSLASTVESMRMRQIEQRHLQQLAMEKVDAITQQCLRQVKRMHEYSDEIVRLKEQNTNLAQENDRLQARIELTVSESVKRDTAVNAMSSAVAGLEGWINNTPSPNYSQRKVVTRGKGRFRGRYYVDDPDEIESGHHSLETSEIKVREGVNSWLRGFRDIEDELRSSAGGTPPASRKNFGVAQKGDEEEWGDFESAGV